MISISEKNKKITEQLEPKDVFRFFGEICNIPHGSYNIDRISDYLVAFAKERGLRYVQDGEKNVIIFKEASVGYENAAPVMLQGHMDMVAVKTPESGKDMQTEPLTLALGAAQNGEACLYAEETSLGGDDGIAVAMGLALLDDASLAHPALEVVFTTNEETGMEGARGIDFSGCRARRLLNLDSEEEGVFTAGCAGGVRVNGTLPVEREKKTGVLVNIKLTGLHGGHSGAEIHKGYANALVLAGRFLRYAWKELSLRPVSLKGGLADNAIPREATLTLLLPENAVGASAEASYGKLCALARRLEANWRNEWDATEPDLRILINEQSLSDAPNAHTVPVNGDAPRARAVSVLTAESTERLSALLVALPNGVAAMSADMPGLTETSLNLGTASLAEEDDTFTFCSLVRSSKDAAKWEVAEKVTAVCNLAGGTTEYASAYSGWQFRKESQLRAQLTEIYRVLFNKEPKIEATHGGLECGMFMEKLPDLDCVSIGPNMWDIHTTEERLSIPSTERTYRLVKAFLAAAK